MAEDALRPSAAPIVLARKPLAEGSVAANVLRWGTGGLNIDATRVPLEADLRTYRTPGSGQIGSDRVYSGGYRGEWTNDRPAAGSVRHNAAGRWPSNLLHDGSDEVLAAFQAFGADKGAAGPASGPTLRDGHQRNCMSGAFNGTDAPQRFYGDRGSPARFFPALGFVPDELDFLAKPTPQERPHAMAEDVTIGGCRLVLGDCLDVLAGMEPCSVDAVVTDPPYGLEFMGKDWDSFRASNAGVEQSGFAKLGKNGTPTFAPNRRNQKCPACGKWAYDHKGRKCECGGWKQPAARLYSAGFQEFCEAWAREVYRVLKPGGHMACFGSSRTYHRMACAIEDAGFEIRDSLMWLYGSGFNKVGYIRDPATKEIVREGWAGSLKPSVEPVLLARKPLSEPTVAAQVLATGTGALNIDQCRVPTGERAKPRDNARDTSNGWHMPSGGSGSGATHDAGRWPPNLLHSGDEQVLAAFQAFGERPTGKPTLGVRPTTGDVYGAYAQRSTTGGGDTGSAARFFPQLGYEPGELRLFYSGKAASSERDYGLDGLPLQEQPAAWGDIGAVEGNPRKPATGHVQRVRNTGPCVKPVALMQWLCKLIVPHNGTVIDPFMGTGSTLVAASRLGMRAIGIEKEREYYDIAVSRLRNDAPLLTAPEPAAEPAEPAPTPEPAQWALFGEEDAA